MGRELVFRGQPRLSSQVGEAPALSSFGAPSIYVYTLWRRTTKFGVV